ncbi:putative RNA-directed DNA polymerase from transposon BS [Stylophora pistillata]|uniref:Putative RNA-directed DNA polymerase from transposon BS n=1 Tax=Stylophora pistillata TaxID=50429 RepID=A0A2B4SFF4_STYPI|nr:putative RNA-directed DNA polymerase from transposon BS [Stylophora pistillata]
MTTGRNDKEDFTQTEASTGEFVDEFLEPTVEELLTESRRDNEKLKEEILNLKIQLNELQIAKHRQEEANKQLIAELLSERCEALETLFNHGAEKEKMEKKCNLLEKKLQAFQEEEEEEASQNTKKGKAGRPRKLAVNDEFFIVMCRLRRGLAELHLANLFGVSHAKISRLFTTYINYVYLKTGQVNIWPSRALVDKTMPDIFKEKYPNTRGLVGIATNGAITFISQLYTGSISDREIVTRNGCLDLKFDKGDAVMADKGFTVEEILPLGVSLNIPPFLGESAQMSKENEITTQQIASVRIHIERAISLIKNYHIWDDHFTPFTRDSPPSLVPQELFVSNKEVFRSLSSLNVTKAEGPGSIRNKLLQYFAHELSPVIRSIYNQFLKEGCIPSLLKSSIVTPVPKVNPPREIKSDLRPISLTRTLAKVMEGFTCNKLLPRLHGKIDLRQIARRGHSTTDALLFMLQAIYEAGDSADLGSRVFFADSSKGFDLIDHNILMTELRKLEVDPVLISWIAAFLADRQQAVRIGRTLSDWKFLEGGVPQGTKLADWHLRVKFVDDTVCHRNTTQELYQSAQLDRI